MPDDHASHLVNKADVSRIIYKVRSRLLRLMKCRALSTTETAGIHLCDPLLHAQKQLV